MTTLFLLITSSVLFAVGSHFLIKQIVRRPMFFRSDTYSRSALKVERYYKMFSWTVMESLFIYALVILTLELMAAPPF